MADDEATPPGERGDAPPLEREAPPKKTKAPRVEPMGPPSLGGVALGLARRPGLVLLGALACGLVSLVGRAISPTTEDALFNLVSYAPILGGAWAVWAYATATDLDRRGHWPNVRRALRFASTAMVVIVLSGLARVTLTVLGELVVKTALALGPTVALAEAAWPHTALWRGLLVIDAHPREFAKLAGISALVLVLTTLLVPWSLQLAFGTHTIPSGGGFVGGLARGLGWAVIAALWMRFYLRIRETSDAL